MFDIQYIYNNHYNIIIIGDIHGDLKRLKNILLNEKYNYKKFRMD